MIRYKTGSRINIFVCAISIFARSVRLPSGNSPAFIFSKSERFSSTVLSRYGLFTPEFQNQWPPDRFAGRLNEVVSNPRLGQFTSLQAGDRLILQNTAAGRAAYGNVIFTFSGLPDPAPQTVEYRPVDGDAWKIQDMPALFSPEAMQPQGQ